MNIEYNFKIDTIDTVGDPTNLHDRVSEVGGCEAAVTARTRCGWAISRVCGKLLYGRRFPLKTKKLLTREL